ncbi:uncharacterized protein BP01DRAFT_52808 [Aspergillus saccharolyticus JOP 1030-1]|uniref:Uncharacterized protein n=1 Tax=Aspergillus saccharolyticus JOP 1030-1 TaxID=1450539 RepID=A0A318ZC71_9EURO|nr:hypothetical protein BP01DRAFT_52808 [Aspergillus saccharolyticus JOP 1030-1]PYH45071.1 hypothetical protein BP01DRAFT_52808 [Aspergillus saccharolyticus JOP 1030-1]
MVIISSATPPPERHYRDSPSDSVSPAPGSRVWTQWAWISVGGSCRGRDPGFLCG